MQRNEWPDHAVAWQHVPAAWREAWVGFLRTHAAVTRALDDELQTAHGLSLADFDVLRQLSSAPDRRLRMSELADRVLLSRSGLTRLVGRLEERGLVARERSGHDVRQVFAVLTDTGSQLLIAAEPTHVDGVRRLFWDQLRARDVDALVTTWRRLRGGPR